MDNRPLVVCLMGPTGTGKTDLALALADRFPVALISVDAAQVYRRLDIGTAKLPAGIRAQYPHDLIDVADVTEIYSAARFCAAARASIERAIMQKKLPVLVGGTMFYFSALRKGLDHLPPRNDALRAEISGKLLPTEFYAALQKIAPSKADRLHPNDHQRLLRALEIEYQQATWRSKASIASPMPEKSYQFLSYALRCANKEVLWERLANRLELMYKKGLVEEVEKIKALPGVHAELPAMKMIGYRQVYAYLSGKLDYFMAKYQTLCASRQLAKRQMTWLRRWEELTWLPAESLSVAIEMMVDDIVKHSNGTLK